MNATDNWGVTPMYLAASSGQVDVIQYLIAAGAKLSFKNLVRAVTNVMDYQYLVENVLLVGVTLFSQLIRILLEAAQSAQV